MRTLDHADPDSPLSSQTEASGDASEQISSDGWRVVHERFPFTERERALARRLGISLQGALSVTNLEELAQLGTTVEDPTFRADCLALLNALRAL